MCCSVSVLHEFRMFDLDRLEASVTLWGPRKPCAFGASRCTVTIFMSIMENDKSSVTYETFNVAMNAQLLR